MVNNKPAQSQTSVSKSPSALMLVVCIAGIYGSFLSWSYLQEKISSKNYSSDGEAYFKAPLIINSVQAFFAMIVGTVYMSVKSRRLETPFHFLFRDAELLRNFVLIALSQAVSSPIAYQSLNHLDYLFYLLAKSCKLIPVMLVHRLLYNSKFPPYKYVVAGLVTFGVVVFSISNETKSTSNDVRKNHRSSSHGRPELAQRGLHIHIHSLIYATTELFQAVHGQQWVGSGAGYPNVRVAGISWPNLHFLNVGELWLSATSHSHSDAQDVFDVSQRVSFWPQIEREPVVRPLDRLCGDIPGIFLQDVRASEQNRLDVVY
ncbi:hypothetical protein KL933_003818 [Ogataea haglerorum]|uniref:UDP-galactose transporter homolog 1 n=1 Tax=Ogataea haglerorum TaxID=1937702 RepID=A0AAN6D3G1_9ASCO|nr:hypothetical protein KL914_002826 [Ogataea haglerorum]KAG7725770.1 hypothetical protein KL933_003818 [Ogataea haglerorum]KAG7731805.1 hypothetical protein KL948_002738 [Ogataea haglerorum]KAG7758675.1 hypothetical protein KL947_002344 [Ogataea haglerorum]KAG7765981.1 hypothetical protein KL946_002161 [Ogataea haglerorum]